MVRHLKTLFELANMEQHGHVLIPLDPPEMCLYFIALVVYSKNIVDIIKVLQIFVFKSINQTPDKH